jgi:chemotaxis family two-component system response regulator Rcp1
MGESGSNPNPEEDRPSASPSLSKEAARYGDILIVEDNPGDVYLIRAAIKAANIDTPVHVVKDGERATQFFDEADSDHAAPCPGLVVLDINLPRKQGGDVLRHMRRSRRCSEALVIVVSTSESAPDRENMMKLGANSYFRKPSEYGEFMKLGNMIKELLDSGL